MKRIVTAVIFAMTLSIAVFADIAPRPDGKQKPTRKPKQVEADMVIRIDSTATEARLIVPKTHLPKLRAELEGIDIDAADDTAAATGVQRMQTIIGGTFLSLAFVFGGMWIVRRKGNGAAALGVIAAVVATAGTVSLVYANIGPPPSERKITSKIFDPNVIRPFGYVSGKVKVEVGNSDTFELIVPDEGVARTELK